MKNIMNSWFRETGWCQDPQGCPKITFDNTSQREQYTVESISRELIEVFTWNRMIFKLINKFFIRKFLPKTRFMHHDNKTV